MNTIVMMRNDAGEGSRGGKIIGHTSGGKPIYMNHGHTSHKSFTREEHNEAADVHTKHLHKAYERMFAAEKGTDKSELKEAQNQVNVHGLARRHHLKVGHVVTPHEERFGFAR